MDKDDDRYAKYNNFAGPSAEDEARAEARQLDQNHHRARRNAAIKKMKDLSVPDRSMIWGVSKGGTARHYR